MTDNNNGLYQLSTPSPPKSEVDENSLQKSMDKNKESLKVKLMLRRPITQLIDQGIMPPLKTPPAFHEQRQKLERAKTGDLLKSKIQRRPARQQLIQQHILEDTTVDPSLQERQRLLKKARLQDDLNDRLSHRPGPLELIKGNILKTEEPLAQAIKEGQLTFRNTSEGELRKHPGPMFSYEEDSGSDGALSPSQESSIDSQGLSSASSVCSSDGQGLQLSSPSSLTTIASSISDIRSPLSSLSSPSGSIGSPPTTTTFAPFSSAFCNATTSSSLNQIRSNQSSCPIKQEPGGGKARKKSKSKSQPKTKTIKFHEYKGPPNAQKSNNNGNGNSQNSSESTYDLLLQQQQLFLQWQLEWQHKYPQILLPATQKTAPTSENTPALAIGGSAPSAVSSNCNSGTSTPVTSQSRQSSPPVLNNVETSPGSPLVRAISKLEDLKVSDLKAELKKRNLPVSGPKPQLIERLKPFSNQVMQPNSAASVTNIDFNMCSNSPPAPIAASINVQPMNTINSSAVDDISMSASTASPPISPFDQSLFSPAITPMDVETASPSSTISFDGTQNTGEKQQAPAIEENAKQHKRIQELQNEIQRNQVRIQKQINHSNKQSNQPQQAGILGSNTAKMLQQHLQQKIQHQQNLQRQKQQQLQQQQLQQLQEHQQKQILQNQAQKAPSDVTKQLQPQTVQIPIVSTNGANISIGASHMSLPSTLTGQLLISPGQNVLTTANIPLLALTNNNQVNILGNNSEFPIGKTVRANSLPNGLGHVRTGSLPSFSPPSQMQRTTTDPQFIITRPPPAYDEATKKTAIKSDETKSEDDIIKKKLAKSQAVEDVLEILIKNGELPASVVQEPITPTTPGNKSSSEPPTFPTSPISSESSDITVKTEPSDSFNKHLDDLISSAEDSNQQGTSNFDFDLGLGFDGLEPMDFGNLTGDNASSPPLLAERAPNVVVSQNSSIMNPSCNVPMTALDLIPATSNDDHVGMDVDIEWFDSMISSPSTPVAASHSIHHPELPINLPQQESTSNLYHSNNNENNRDPMLSVTSALHDPLDLFSLSDTDFKGPADLNNSLNWDTIDFCCLNNVP